MHKGINMVVIRKNHVVAGQDVASQNSSNTKNHLTESQENIVKDNERRESASKDSNSQNNGYTAENINWSENIVERGKDLLSSEASSVATAAAIIVGAALIEVELIPGLVIGAGAILLSKVFPELTSYIRPLVKGAVRAGFSATHKVRQIIAETSEQVSDLVAEVKNEQEPSIKQETVDSSNLPVANELPRH